MQKPALITAGSEAARFQGARSASQAWRGACMERMAEVEYRLSRLLLSIADHPACAIKAKTLHLAGQKVEHLRHVLVRPGPVSTAVPDGIAILDDYARFDDLRSYLAHGALELSGTEQGVILWTFRLLRFSAGHATSGVLILTEADARSARKALLEAGCAVIALFDRVQAAVAVQTMAVRAYPRPMMAVPLPIPIPAVTVGQPVTPAAAIPRS